MRRPLPRWTSLLASAALLTALAGCGDDGADATQERTQGSTGPTSAPTTDDTTSSPTPTGTGEDGSAEEEAFCAAVTAQELQQAVGQPFYDPQGAGDDPEVLSCQTGSEDGSVLVSWSLQPSTASLDEAVDTLTLPGLDRSPVTVAGQQGALLTGDQPVGRSARVVALIDGQVLFAGVDTNTGVGDVDLSAQAQQALVQQIADQAAAAAG